MNAILTRKDQAPVTVKNLGWLLRNWQEVDGFFFVYDPLSGNDGKLIAALADGGSYETEFADLTVAFRWLNRSIFKGLPLIIWRGNESTTWKIGDSSYVATMKRDCSAGVAGYKARIERAGDRLLRRPRAAC